MYWRSLTISKNASSKQHAICMQAFLHAAKLLATINEKPNERNTSNASKSAHYKVSEPVVEKCLAIPTEAAKSITSHTRHVRFASQRYKQLDSWWHGFSWSDSPRHGLPSRAHVARAKWNTSEFRQAAVGQKNSSLNSWGMMGKVWVKSSWQFWCTIAWTATEI